MIKICRNAGSQRLRHTSRTRRVHTAFIAEQFQAMTQVCLYAVQSADQAADMYTKRFTDPVKWFQLLYLNHIIDPATFWKAKISDDYVAPVKVKQKVPKAGGPQTTTPLAESKRNALASEFPSHTPEHKREGGDPGEDTPAAATAPSNVIDLTEELPVHQDPDTLPPSKPVSDRLGEIRQDVASRAGGSTTSTPASIVDLLPHQANEGQFPERECQPDVEESPAQPRKR